MNPELGADGSGFLGLPGGPTLLVAGRLQSGPGVAFLGPKRWIFLGIWAGDLSGRPLPALGLALPHPQSP
jgi:hypothetical protein